MTLYSPYLFILVEDILSLMIKVELEGGSIGKFYHPRGCPLISHLLYVNDLLVFMNEEYKSLKQLLKTIGIYERWSGQLLTMLSPLYFS